MSQTKQDIAELIANNLYDTAILNDLESYVNTQAKTSEYDFDANRHLLKLYLFAPDTIKVDVLSKILLMSLMQLPESDFVACTCLIPARQHDEDEIRTIFKLSTLLESAQFKRFWNVLAEDKVKKIVSAVPDFDVAVRKFIGVTVSNAHQSIPTATLEPLLNLEKKEFEAFASKSGWKVEGATVTFPLTEFNQFQPAAVPDNLGVEQIAKLLQHV